MQVKLYWDANVTNSLLKLKPSQTDWISNLSKTQTME